MKYFLIGFGIWFIVTWFPHFLKAWFLNIRLWRKRKHANHNEKWIYEVLK